VLAEEVAVAVKEAQEVGELEEERETLLDPD